MAGRAPGYQDILTSLFITGDVENAVKLTLERGDNAYSFFRYVRRKIIQDDSFRRKDYLQRVRHFQHVHFSPQDKQWEDLNRLMEGSLHSQYRVESSRKPFLGIHDETLRKIRCLPDAFYDYTIPDDVVEEALERDRESREIRHCQPMNISNIQQIVSRAREWRQFTHPWDLVACASIICGRRTQEIVLSMRWKRESDFIAGVAGLVKQNIGAGPIPILVPYQEFDELMIKIRENDLPIDSSTHRLKPAFMRVFGEWFNHTQRRNIYCEAAYRMRDESGFFPNYSKIMWFDKALCHDSNVIHQAPSLSYQLLTFNE